MSDALTVLLVQENGSVDAIYRQLRDAVSIEVVLECAETVEQAFAVLDRNVIGAILLDLDLPGTHELDAFIRLHLRAPEIPILVFAETVSVERGLAAVRAGAQDCLTRAEIESPLLARALGFAIERQTIRHVTHSHAEQLQFSEARFRLLINENADAIVVINGAGVVRFANPAAAALFGISREILVGSLLPISVRDDETVPIVRQRDTALAHLRVVETLWDGEHVLLVTLRDVSAQMDLLHAQRAEQHQREMALALADSAAVLNSTLRVELVLDRILENVGRVVAHDAASIFLIENGLAHFVRGKGFAERQLVDLMERLHLPLHEIQGLELMRQTGKPLLIPDTAADPRWVDLTGGWIKSYVGTPLRVQAQTIGFLNLDSATRNFFDASHAVDLEAFAAYAAAALDNARFHASQQKRAEEFAALYDLTRELAMQRDFDALLDTVVERAMGLLNSPCGGLALYVPGAEELEARVSKGEPTNLLGLRIKMGEGLVGQVGVTREPLIVDDYQTWEFRSERFDDRRISAVLGVPMLFGGELVGVLSMREWENSTRRYTENDAQLLMLIATQAAAFVHNARLHDETVKRAQQMGLLYDAGLTLNSVLESGAQLDFLTRIAMRSLHAERAAFFRYAETTQELLLEFALGFSETQIYTYKARVPLKESPGIEAWVARERLPVTLDDTLSDLRFAVTDDGILSGVWVPVEHDNRLLGVLAVGSMHLHAFNLQDERLLTLFANQAAIALENARLYQNALQANERRAVLHWASQEIISAGLDAERVYLAIHQAASRLMPCEAFVIAVLDEAGEWIQLPYLFDRGGRQPSGKIPKARGLAGHMLRMGKAMVIPDLTTSGIDAINFGYPVPVNSVLAVPLRHGGEVFGMLSAETYEPDAYTMDDCVMLEMLAAHAAAALMNVRGAEKMLQSLESAYLETALALAKTIDMRDTYTGAHSDHIANLAETMARKMELTEEETQALRLGARLHDIGKIGVPDEVLRKPGPLTDGEWVLMRRHPEIGAEILALVRPLQRVIPIVRHHQEHFDGSGYPDGLAGEAIPLGARILAVIDAFSAMTDDRVYRQGRSPEEAMAELERCAGTQFDPQVVEVFLKMRSGN